MTHSICHIFVWKHLTSHIFCFLLGKIMKEVSGRLKKPVMHGLSVKAGKGILLQVLVTGCVLSVITYTTLWNKRRDIYRKFYENYDADKEFERMRSKNIFDSCWNVRQIMIVCYFRVYSSIFNKELKPWWYWNLIYIATNYQELKYHLECYSAHSGIFFYFNLYCIH